MGGTERNWAGNYAYRAARVHYPKTVEQVQALVRSCSKVKALGSRHSFNDIADSPEDLISLEQFDHVVAIDPKRHMVTVDAGVRYGHLCQQLHDAGYALPNLASLPHISIAGACATGTHGSGEGNSNLATVVSAMELITANGDKVVLSREQDGEQFQGAVINLGGLGVITQLTLDLMPTFAVRQDVYENLSLAQLEEHFDEIEARAYSVSLFTDWQSGRINQVWMKSHVTDRTAVAAEPVLFGATLATRQSHPLTGLPVENCTVQMGIPGPWHDRLPHFRMEFTPSNGEELQSEYLVPREHALPAIRAIHQVGNRLASVLQISELRTVAADTLWMSPCYKQDCVALHFTWVQDWPAVEKLLPLIEEQLAPFNARPHWGKLFTMSPAHLQSLFEKLPDFRALLHSYDPQGKFRNVFLDKYIFGV